MRAYLVVKLATAAYFLALSGSATAAPKPSLGTSPSTPAPGPSAPAPAPSPPVMPSATPPSPPETTVPPAGDSTGTVPPEQRQEPASTIPTPVRRDIGKAPQPRRAGPGQVLLNVDGVDDAEADEPPEVRHARDTLGSHLIVAANAGLFFPGGAFDDATYQSDKLTVGPSFGADIGFGISRTVVLGVYGQLALPGDEKCSSCSASSIAVGPLIRYHLVQGVRFDPWLSAGAGFRKTTLGNEAWTGVDIVKLALGGDFYAWPSLGFGPFAEVTVGTYFDATPKLTSHNVNATFTLGLRIVFDAPGK
jgi:hypothetical protein